MAGDAPKASANGINEADLAKVPLVEEEIRTDGATAQAFQELAKGESTATALENQLSAMEAKIEELLVQAERDQNAVQKLQNENGLSDKATEKGPEERKNDG
ncbi:hypothetical protein K431DRAFT_298044 [Polychaeton citri CBS 116435]|uniref:Uncharacterized protein n=1 Tax=Polychaeton citri CBS 116435 TaxID=1314669 RepID=A0A9P4Q354_9PEZI|nr:hypothetical protein K431DRAFT_298044 [Polychaeton citri CBS 116435]